MMELMVASPIRRERISHVTEWSKVPQATVDITVGIQTPKPKEGKFIATSDKEFEVIGEARKSVQSVEWPKVPQTIIAERNIEVQLSNSHREERTAAPRPTVEEVLGSVTGSHIEVQSSGSSREENVAPPIPSVEVILGSGAGRCAPNPGQGSAKQHDNAPGEVAAADEVDFTESELGHTVKLPASPPMIYSDISQVVKEIEAIDCTPSTKPAATSKSTTPNTPIAKSPKPDKLVQRATTLSRLGLMKNQWPDPHLSIGAKCNPLSGNECWKAIGPAEALFALIFQPIKDLLDARVDELEEGEPVAGHILLFDLYMIGKSPATARPTLLFTCRTPKRRKRAIKFVKESGLLKPHPKIALAESAVPPLVMGNGGYVRLLAGPITHSIRGQLSYPVPSPATLVPRTTSTSAPNHQLYLGIGIGSTLGGVAIFFVLGILRWYLLRRKKMKKNAGQGMTEIMVEYRENHKSFQPSKLGISEDNHPKMTQASAIGIKTNTFTGPGRLHPQPLLNQEIHELSIDPPIMRPAEALGSIRRPSCISGANSVVHEMEANSQGHRTQPLSHDTIRFINKPPEIHLWNQMTEIQNFTSCKALVVRKSVPSAGPLDGNKLTDGKEISVRFFGQNVQSILRRDDLYGYCGIPIIGSSTNLLSTIGGILHLNGVFYGLTVCHVFGNPTQSLSFSVPSPDQQEDESEFAFDEDDEEVQDIEMTDVATTSQASISYAGSTDSISRSSTTDSTISRVRTSQLPSPIETRVLYKEENISSPSIRQDSSKLGVLAAQSAQESQLGLDWALIRLSDNSVEDTRRAFRCNNFAAVNPPHYIISTLEEEVSVTSITGYSGTITGVLSPGFTPMKLSPRSKFQDVWTIVFDKPLSQGDSGSWVFNSMNGGLYGHIVAGIPESCIAYIIPAFKTFENIRQQIGPVQFDSEIFLTEDPGAYHQAKVMMTPDAVATTSASIH